VNSFFIGKERELLSALPQHDGTQPKVGVSAEATELFFTEVSELYACVILNYLAVLKIVKVRTAPLAQRTLARERASGSTDMVPSPSRRPAAQPAAPLVEAAAQRSHRTSRRPRAATTPRAAHHATHTISLSCM
jgi:hypothetical protein